MSQIDPTTGEVVEEVDPIKMQLNLLAEFQAQRDLLAFEMEEMIATILTPELLKEVDDIKAEFAGKAETANENIAKLTKIIKDACLERGEPVKGDYLQVVWSKGRTGGWDNKGLAGYAVANPEILQFKKPDGKPTASLRKVGK